MSKKNVYCKTCGKEIAENAKVCPGCGEKNKKPLFKKPIFWILIIAVVIGIISDVGSGSEPEIDYSKPDFVVTADEIMSEFTENSVSAQEKYADKMVEVSGEIKNISEYTVQIGGKDDENWLTDIVLSLKSGQTDVVKSLSKGMKITAIGKLDPTDFFDDIKLNDAVIDTKDIEIKTTESKQEQEQSPEEVIEVYIDDIIEAYNDNSVSADDKYKDKTLKVTGKIYSIEDSYIKLESSDEWNFTYIYAYYNLDEDVTRLKKGQKVTVTGVCKGEDVFSDIKIKNCTIDK